MSDNLHDVGRCLPDTPMLHTMVSQNTQQELELDLFQDVSAIF